jgi:hypothetical protein
VLWGLALRVCVGEVGLNDPQDVLQWVVKSMHHGGNFFQVQQVVVVLCAFNTPTLWIP